MYVRVRRDAHQDLAGDQVVSNASSNDQESYNNNKNSHQIERGGEMFRVEVLKNTQQRKNDIIISLRPPLV